MAFEFFEESFTADIGFTATGRTPEELMIAAAEATMQVMVEDLAGIAGRERKEIRIEAESLEMALFDLLQELIFFKDAEELLLRLTRVVIAGAGDRLVVTAEAWGEQIDRDRHQLQVDVKAVTLHRFKVEETPEGWTATVVLDI
jgi:SHS2 domain-containing protein